jgi:glycosyltransferase involved in cell wall biosynthesis
MTQVSTKRYGAPKVAGHHLGMMLYFLVKTAGFLMDTTTSQTEPFLSFIIPLYNIEEYVGECVGSFLKLDLERQKKIELIFVDDLSTDQTIARLKEASSDLASKIKIIQLEKQGGPGNARNLGIEKAQGKYIAFLDGDDTLDAPAYYEAAEQCQKEDADLALLSFERFYPDGIKVPHKNIATLKTLKKTITQADQAERAKVLDDIPVVWNKIYKREFIIENKLRFPDGYYEDAFWHCLAATLAKTIIIIPEIAYFYRQRAGSIVGTQASYHTDLFLQYNRLFEETKRRDISLFFQNRIRKKSLQHICAILYGNRLNKASAKIFLNEAADFIKENKLKPLEFHKNTIYLRLLPVITKSILMWQVLFQTKKALFSLSSKRPAFVQKQK